MTGEQTEKLLKILDSLGFAKYDPQNGVGG